MTSNNNFDDVTQVADNTDTEDDEVSTSSSEDDKERSSGDGAICRIGSDTNVSSRKNSMRPQVKKPAMSAGISGMSNEDEQEARNEIAKAVSACKDGNPYPQVDLSRLNLHSPIVDLLLRSPLGSLRVLVLGENNIESLPHNIFDRTPMLEKIDLTNNKLSVIPLSVMTLTKLQQLLFDHNQISSVPQPFDIAEPFHLPELLEIGLEWNRLAEYPAHLHEFAPKLTKVFICENLGIHHLPPVAAFPKTPRIEIRLDNRPTLQAQYESGGYAERFTPLWNKIYPDKVMDFVYLGSLRTAQCQEVYNDLDIKFVLTAGRHLDVFLSEGMQQLELPLDDVPSENIATFFDQAFQFIDKAREQKKGVLLHCFAGLSRSVTVMVAYLMKTQRMTRDEALHFVRCARPNSQPNEGFLRSLLLFEAALKNGSK